MGLELTVALQMNGVLHVGHAFSDSVSPVTNSSLVAWCT